MLLVILEGLQLQPWQFIYFCGVIAFAAVIRGYAGFGFSAVVVAALSLIMLSREAVSIVILLEIVASLQMAPSIWKSIHWKLVGCILLGATLLTPLGQAILVYLPQNIIQTTIAIIVMIAVILLYKGFTPAIPNKPVGWIFVGAVAGFFNGIAALGGLGIMILLINTGLSAAILRASLAAIFFFIDCYASIFAIQNNIMDTTTLYRTFAAIPFLFFGIKLGSYYFNPENTDTYKRVALLILFGLASLLLII
jgi:uncharacterized membrane protein YfcA